MQPITFLKQLLSMMREGSRAEDSAEKPSVIALRKYMLFEGNFKKDIKRLYSLGHSSFQPSNLKSLSDKELWEKLCNLHCLLEAWEDSGLSRDNKENKENKKQRHALKYKKDLAKPTRRTIHKALNIEVINLADALKVREKDSDNVAVLSGNQLIDLTSQWLHALKIINPDLESPEDKDIEKRFKKAASAITSFKTLTQKFIAALSVSVAIIAGLACGFFTGGAIYALIAGALLPGVVIPIVVIAGLIGFAVNVRFFSKSLPEFLVKLTNLSRITEFINEKGEREQFSNLKKYVYLPLAALFSVAVGISFAAFSLVQLAGMLVALPFLVAIGPLPIILAVVLAITMTIVMFKAFVELAPNLPFSQLWQSLKTTWKEMSFMKLLSYGYYARRLGRKYLFSDGVPTRHFRHYKLLLGCCFPLFLLRSFLRQILCRVSCPVNIFTRPITFCKVMVLFAEYSQKVDIELFQKD
ncbi:hypothetical protein [Rickettsiella endosymbiont of Dermanyssus gallinae]|uniref:hypothetical protein n=1 Tax=Rickettsiella endosymbiont of Dermanyssus gallinae TaxID=2856608 RepID=UPI001C52AB88|nr:hypothetical protein [Rickettsiella endosymbiont of Dermanyssus gallinae]